MTKSTREPEAVRLEQLWQGGFGDAYIERNMRAGEGRKPFWERTLAEFPARNVLEVGCNVGGNLRWLAELRPPRDVYGVDISDHAIAEVHARLPGVNAMWAPARELPFRDRQFDLTFTTGVLIHQPPAMLPLVMAEVVRCSRRWVLCGEYFAEKVTEVPYRGQSGALFKRDFGALYRELFPDLTLRGQGFLPKAEGGWDDVTWWVFEKVA